MYNPIYLKLELLFAMKLEKGESKINSRDTYNALIKMTIFLHLDYSIIISVG